MFTQLDGRARQELIDEVVFSLATFVVYLRLGENRPLDEKAKFPQRREVEKAVEYGVGSGLSRPSLLKTIYWVRFLMVKIKSIDLAGLDICAW
jgi:hypothetical protein